MKKDGLTEAEASERAGEMSVCVYSPGQHDGEQYAELVEYQIPPEDVTPKIVPKFLDPDDPLKFIIVCNKLLSGSSSAPRRTPSSRHTQPCHLTRECCPTRRT